MPWKQNSLIEQREKLVLAMQGRRESVRVLCRRLGISRQSAYKYLRRFKQEGRSGLKTRRRGPRPKQATQWAGYVRMILRQRRRRPSWGARKLRWWLRERCPRRHLPSERTVERWLRSAGLVTRDRPRPRPPQWRPRPRQTRRSNEVWTFDWKGWFRSGDGTKIEPLTVRDLGSRVLFWVLPLAQRSDKAVRRVCRRLFRIYGCPKTIRTDHGGPFRGNGPYGLTSLSLWWYRLGITVEFVGRSRGVDNNAHEQMHGVMKRETARPPARTREAQLRRLRRWQHEYNHDRPHEGIGQQPPLRRYRPQPAPLPPLLVPTYPENWLVRKVHHNGDIHLSDKRHYIGRTFAGLPVGCRPVAGGYRVYFHRLPLATILASHLSSSQVWRGGATAPPDLPSS
jgi:transposase